MKNKRGGYIVEAAISLPVLIIAVCSLILTISISMICEGITFSTAESLIEIIRNPYNNYLSVSLCKKIEKNVLSDEVRLTDFKVIEKENLYIAGDDQEHIGLTARGKFSVINPIGINGRITFTESIIARPMAGKNSCGNVLSEDDFCGNGKSKKVMVFPKYGEKYHTKNCLYVKRAKKEDVCQLEMEEIDAGLKDYNPCLVCGGAAND